MRPWDLHVRRCIHFVETQTTFIMTARLWSEPRPGWMLGRERSSTIQTPTSFGSGQVRSGILSRPRSLPLGWQGFKLGASNVLIKALTIEHVGGTGIQGPGSWEVDGVEARWNHVNGVDGPFTLSSNYLHDNGQAGFEENCECPASQVLHKFADNESAYNNSGSYAGYNLGYDASGMKFMQTGNIEVDNNYIHDNGGPGLWSDTNVVNAIYSGNRVMNNKGPGIEVEVSYSHTIVGNDIEENLGAGISIQNTGPAEISENEVGNNQGDIQETQIDRGVGAFGYYSVHDVNVHDNVIIVSTGWDGLKVWEPSTAYYTSMGNVWSNNTYVVSCNTISNPFVWMSGSVYSNLTWTQWAASGNGIGGGIVC